MTVKRKEKREKMSLPPFNLSTCASAVALSSFKSKDIYPSEIDGIKIYITITTVAQDMEHI